MRHNWTFVVDTDKVCIYVDYRQRITKIEGNKYTSYHEGIYPNQNPYPSRKYKHGIRPRY